MKIYLVITSVLLAAAGQSSAQDLGTEQQRSAGKVVYDQMCSQCHGESGDGKGVAQHYFRPAPRDFTFGVFKIRSTGSGELPTQEDLEKIVRDGMPYTGMRYRRRYQTFPIFIW